VAHHQVEHRVAEELEALVVAAGGAGVLVEPRGVAQRDLERGAVA
jgi:hypothetical protein